MQESRENTTHSPALQGIESHSEEGALKFGENESPSPVILIDELQEPDRDIDEDISGRGGLHFDYSRLIDLETLAADIDSLTKIRKKRKVRKKKEAQREYGYEEVAAAPGLVDLKEAGRVKESAFDIDREEGLFPEEAPEEDLIEEAAPPEGEIITVAELDLDDIAEGEEEEVKEKASLPEYIEEEKEAVCRPETGRVIAVDIPDEIKREYSESISLYDLGRVNLREAEEIAREDIFFLAGDDLREELEELDIVPQERDAAEEEERYHYESGFEEIPVHEERAAGDEGYHEESDQAVPDSSPGDGAYVDEAERERDIDDLDDPSPPAKVEPHEELVPVEEMQSSDELIEESAPASEDIVPLGENHIDQEFMAREEYVPTLDEIEREEGDRADGSASLEPEEAMSPTGDISGWEAAKEIETTESKLEDGIEESSYTDEEIEEETVGKEEALSFEQMSEPEIQIEEADVEEDLQECPEESILHELDVYEEAELSEEGDVSEEDETFVEDLAVAEEPLDIVDELEEDDVELLEQGVSPAGGELEEKIEDDSLIDFPEEDIDSYEEIAIGDDTEIITGPGQIEDDFDFKEEFFEEDENEYISDETLIEQDKVDDRTEIIDENLLEEIDVAVLSDDEGREITEEENLSAFSSEDIYQQNQTEDSDMIEKEEERKEEIIEEAESSEGEPVLESEAGSFLQEEGNGLEEIDISAIGGDPAESPPPVTELPTGERELSFLTQGAIGKEERRGNVYIIDDEAGTEDDLKKEIERDEEKLRQIVSGIVELVKGEARQLDVSGEEEESYLKIDAPVKFEDFHVETEEKVSFVDEDIDFVDRIFIEEEKAEEASLNEDTAEIGERGLAAEETIEKAPEKEEAGFSGKDLRYILPKSDSLSDEEKKSIEEDLRSGGALILEENVDDIRERLDYVMKKKIEASIQDITDKIRIIEDDNEVNDSVRKLIMENKDDLERLMKYLDGLLGKLPEDDIKKFADSDYYDLYLRVLKEMKE